MTRVVFWNLDDFSVEAVHGKAMSEGGFGVGAASSAAQTRLTLLRNMVSAVKPDLIVLTGFRCDRALSAVAGELMTGAGLDGLRLILSLLRSIGGGGWAMTPPIRSSGSDGVAILFHTEGLVFAGPYGWSGGQNGRSMDVAASIPRDYPDAFAGFLPEGRKVPTGAPVNAGLLERRLALRATGFTVGDGRTAFPDAFFAGSADVRAPVLCAFAELNGTSFRRMVYLAAIRAPENAAAAGLYNARLAEIDALEPTLAAGDAIAIVGSFGENIYDRGTLAESLMPLRQRGFIDGFRDAPPTGGETDGFYSTVLEPVETAKYYSEKNNLLVYPAYGHGVLKGASWSVDMVFAKPDALANSFTVLNPVVGCPYYLDKDWPPEQVFKGKIGFFAVWDG